MLISPLWGSVWMGNDEDEETMWDSGGKHMEVWNRDEGGVDKKQHKLEVTHIPT